MISYQYMGLFPIAHDAMTGKIFLEGSNIEMKYHDRKVPKKYRELLLKWKCYWFADNTATKDQFIDEAFADPTFFEVKQFLSPVDYDAFLTFYEATRAKAQGAQQ